MVAGKEGTMTEKILHRQVCDYIRAQYPKVMFNSDMSGATKLTMGQAVAMKRLRSNRGWPDIFLAEPRANFHGLFIELKPEGTKLYKRDGSHATPHIVEQCECLVQLGCRGYAAAFGVGFDKTKTIIDNYLNLKP